jgi:hypothetical protein
MYPDSMGPDGAWFLELRIEGWPIGRLQPTVALERRRSTRDDADRKDPQKKLRRSGTDLVEVE